MPELPEVETVRSVLESSILGLEIIDIDIRYSNIIVGDIEEFKQNIIHKTFMKMERLGKYLLFQLNVGYLISHLRMEGKYFYIPKEDINNPHIHIIFYLSNGYMLCYQDVRKFGRMEYKKKEELYVTNPLLQIGIDPILSKKIEIKGIYDKIIRRNISIKKVLLDQSILCGLGNIYVDEVLFLSKISPLRCSNTLTYFEVESIINACKIILTEAIHHKGTTIKSYTSSLGVEGEYQSFLKVHTKEICPICNKRISKIKIGGRSTYYCSMCQR